MFLKKNKANCFYWNKVYTVMIINSTNINKSNNHLSSHLIFSHKSLFCRVVNENCLKQNVNNSNVICSHLKKSVIYIFLHTLSFKICFPGEYHYTNNNDTHRNSIIIDHIHENNLSLLPWTLLFVFTAFIEYDGKCTTIFTQRVVLVR
jgi:hypothetical protein